MRDFSKAGKQGLLRTDKDVEENADSRDSLAGQYSSAREGRDEPVPRKTAGDGRKRSIKYCCR